MKKTVLAIALLQAPIFACAQGSLTLYGILDAGITYVNNQQGKSVVMSDSGILQGNRWGFLGKEDLGGGLTAVFNLENGFNLGNGAAAQGGLLFGRTAYVGLASDRFGTFTFGRQYDFMTDFMVENTAAANGATAVSFHLFDADRLAGEQLNNTAKYVSPVWGGISFGAMYGFSNVAGEFAGTDAAPRVSSFGLKFAQGPLVVSAAYTAVTGMTGSLVTLALGGHSQRIWAVGGRYQFDKLKVFGNATSTLVRATAAGNNATINNYEVGAAYFVTPAVPLTGSYTYSTYAGHSYSQINTAAHYFLSKATDVYFALNYQHTTSPTGAGMFLDTTPGTLIGFSSTENQLGVRVGLRKRF
ncbi:porin [Paraburkholderia sp. EG286B]|uniref:porin n=1 Tax=Paraburkholderia sp. EG286B TaxID=3237011 RepID=UPI0034D2D233